MTLRLLFIVQIRTLMIANSLLRILNKYSTQLVVFNTGGDMDEING